MDRIDQLHHALAALAYRVRQLEEKPAPVLPSNADQLRVNHLRNNQPDPDNRGIGRQLHAEGWSCSRIAKAMDCCERTVERWIERG